MLDNLNDCFLCAPENFSGVSNWIRIHDLRNAGAELQSTELWSHSEVCGLFLNFKPCCYFFFIKVAIKTQTRLEKALRLFNNGLCSLCLFIFFSISFQSYGGIRGAVSFSLAILLSQKHFPLREMFITTTIVIVLFTVFFQVGGDSSGPNISVIEGLHSGTQTRRGWVGSSFLRWLYDLSLHCFTSAAANLLPDGKKE